MRKYRVMVIDSLKNECVYFHVEGILSSVLIDGVEKKCIRNDNGAVLIISSPHTHIQTN